MTGTSFQTKYHEKSWWKIRLPPEEDETL